MVIACGIEQRNSKIVVRFDGAADGLPAGRCTFALAGRGQRKRALEKETFTHVRLFFPSVSP
jgi:hypothetical protein